MSTRYENPIVPQMAAAALVLALASCRLKLFTNDITIVQGMDASVLTEATFGGYTEKVVTPVTAVLGDDGKWHFRLGPVVWVGNGVGDPQVVRGVMIQRDDDDGRLWARRLPLDVPMGPVTSSILVMEDIVINPTTGEMTFDQ